MPAFKKTIGAYAKGKDTKAASVSLIGADL